MPSRLWFLLYPWAFLNTLIGLILSFFYGAHSFEWRQGVLTAIAPRPKVIGHPGAQTWGWFVIYTDERYRTEAWGAGLRRHEYRHVKQGLIGGPLFLLAYGVLFLVEYLKKGDDEGWHEAYERNWFERDADTVRDDATGWGT